MNAKACNTFAIKVCRLFFCEKKRPNCSNRAFIFEWQDIAVRTHSYEFKMKPGNSLLDEPEPVQRHVAEKRSPFHRIDRHKRIHPTARVMASVAVVSHEEVVAFRHDDRPV